MGPPERGPLVILLLLACTGAPQSLAECDRLRDANDRTVCRVGFLQGQPVDALQAALATIDDPDEHDLLLVELAVADTTLGPTLCPGTRSPYGARQCEQVLGRPHLAGSPKEGKR